MSEKITITLPDNTTLSATKGQTLQQICPIENALVATVDNQLSDLTRQLLYDANVQFLDYNDPNGLRTYQRGVSFMLVYAVKAILGKKAQVTIAHSINKNYYCELPDLKSPITPRLLQEIEDHMYQTAAKGLPIEKITTPRETAIKIMEDLGFEDKVRLLKYRHNHTVSLYKLNWVHSYFFGEMPPSTALLDRFKLSICGNGFVLQFPDARGQLKPLPENTRLKEVFTESKQWARIVKADTVAALNDQLCQNGSEKLIRVVEALHEKKIAGLADDIAANNKSIVLIAGPTSSGKTSLAHRLGVQLRVNGLIPHIISLDNYYLDRELCPKDEFGNYDFETIKAIDTDLINQHLQALLNGEAVEIPTFNFLTGKREYKGNVLKFESRDVIVMEGIHGLNEITSAGVDAKDKYKIFISALTQINIDDHNRIPTSDTRLLRRIVRDFRTRGATAANTISMWPSVQRGENKYIFPFQNAADAFYNSALVFEMGILKQYAEPVLFDITPDQPEYTEARRLIRFLASFLAVPSETLPHNSILREFVGGSCFYH